MYSKFFILIFSLAFIVGSLGVSLGVVIGSNKVANVAYTLQQKLQKLEEHVEELADNVAHVASSTTALKQKFATEYSVHKEHQQHYQEKLDMFQIALNEQTTQRDQTNTARLVTEWSPYVYKLTCTVLLPNDDGDDPTTTNGSGILEYLNGHHRFITNAHVLEEDGQIIDTCVATRLSDDEDITFSNDTITLQSNERLAFVEGITMSPPGLPTYRRCAATPAIGESVLILGYPSIGGDESIIATEGIISGFDDEFYVTSAKIDRGNSGGAAIHVENNCLLGLPTLVVAGRVESLARILPLH